MNDSNHGLKRPLNDIRGVNQEACQSFLLIGMVQFSTLEARPPCFFDGTSTKPSKTYNCQVFDRSLQTASSLEPSVPAKLDMNLVFWIFADHCHCWGT